jgi:hypothetical protein
MFDALSAPRPAASPTRTPAREDELDAGMRESLDYQILRRTLGAYDQMAQLGRFEFADGRSGQAADLLLAKR